MAASMSEAELQEAAEILSCAVTGALTNGQKADECTRVGREQRDNDVTACAQTGVTVAGVESEGCTLLHKLFLATQQSGVISNSLAKAVCGLRGEGAECVASLSGKSVEAAEDDSRRGYDALDWVKVLRSRGLRTDDAPFIALLCEEAQNAVLGALRQDERTANAIEAGVSATTEEEMRQQLLEMH